MSAQSLKALKDTNLWICAGVALASGATCWGICYNTIVLPQEERIKMLEAKEVVDQCPVPDVSGLWRTLNMEKEAIYEIRQTHRSFVMTIKNPEDVAQDTILEAAGEVRGGLFLLEAKYDLFGRIDDLKGCTAQRVVLCNGVLLER